MIYLTKRVTFSASHVLRNPTLDDKTNWDIYGKCSWPHGHGHNYLLEVTIKGEIPTETGMIIDLKKLKKIIQETIIDKVDHKFLNTDVDFLQGVIPTSENVIVLMWEELEKVLEPGMLYELKLWETENNWVAYRGE
ncbi:MAG: 6-carboxytetrahydropterin synthase [Candidatus Marinimicrobia bacterium]|nr:6-carboxytetrahydropterin synthase [Candidatus Neomarinimicrobiota bacterium]MDD5582864.1 6-carboxytetrahydropterin synthase [Candidatus Neomarinimicrobiota bacterium]